MPGWYPDPAGTAGRFRFWDGQAWSQQTTTDPGRIPPPTLSRSGSDRSAPGGRGWIVALIVLAVVTGLIAIILIINTVTAQRGGGIATEDTNSAEPTISAWDETSRPTPPPTGGALVTCPVTAVAARTRQSDPNRLLGGGLAVNKIQGWRNTQMYLQWVSDFNTQVDTVYPAWMSNIGVGALNHQDGFIEPQVAALQTMECFASSGYYKEFTGRKDLINEEVTVDGRPGWRIRAEVYVTMPELPQVAGDVADIIVVDLGPQANHLGVFISSVTIGDTRRQRLVDASIASLRVI